MSHITIALLGCDDARNAIASTQGFSVGISTDDGAQGLAYISEHKPDLIVLDLVLSGMDGFEVIRATKQVHPEAKILVLTYVTQPAMVERALSLGADFYLIRPIAPELLVQRALDLVLPVTQSTRTPTVRALDDKLANVFLTVGIPAHIKGYQFLREAVKVSMSHPDAISNITKGLYPTVANRFNTSPSKVERAIRHAIEVAWNRGRIENINSIFGVKAYSSADKPTNGEFIALIADKLMTEIA